MFVPDDRWPAILHVDMDAFFAAVEARDHPELAGRPLIVGGDGARGVVASCSYEARAFGVRSAMPSARARRLCPQALFVAGRYHRYSEVSRDIHRIFQSFTPIMEPIALDEAFLDVTGARRLFGPAAEIGWAIRRRIGGELGLDASVGVAPNKFLAKLASEAAKPAASLAGVVPGRGVVEVRPGTELEFLHPHPIEALWGVGPATAARLRRLGVTTVGELADVPVEVLHGAIGRSHGQHLHDLSWARDGRSVESDRPAKSVSHEETYPTDRFGMDELHPEVVRLSDAVAARLRGGGLAGTTVVVKVRYGDFTTITRSCRVPSPVDSGVDIAAVANRLLSSVDLSPGVRLLGVGVSAVASGAAPGAEQLALALPDGTTVGPDSPAPDGEGWRRASDAVEEIRRRFGASAVAPATLLDAGHGVRVRRSGDQQWGPGGAGPKRTPLL